MVKRDFTHLTPDEKINGIKASKLPDHIRSKYHGEDVREALAQSTEMAIQLGINMGLSPDDALSWARKLQEAIPRSEFDSWVATLVDGGPSIFMNTLNELKATYPNGAAGVALVRETDPAKIYVWNGTAWEDFGDYQGIEIKDGTVTSSKIADDSITQSKTNFLTLDTSINLFGGDWENFGLPGNTFAMTLGKRPQDIAGALVEVKPSTTYSIAAHPSFTGVSKFNTATKIMNVGETLNGAVSKVYGSVELLTTFTTGPNDKYLYVGLSNRTFLKIVESKTPQRVTDADEYPVVPNGISIYSKREVDTRLTNQSADNMTFLKQTDGNLFDGNWVVGKTLGGGSEDLTLANMSGRDVAMIQVEPSTTYSVVLSDNQPADDGYYYFKVGTSSLPINDLKFATSNIAIDGIKVAISIERLHYTFTTNATDKTLLILAGKNSHPYVEVTKGATTELKHNSYERHYTFKDNILINKTNKKKWVFFGDSLVQLKKLPERVSEIIGEDITDVSFAGGALTRHKTYYNAQSVLTLTDQIIAGDFTPLNTALNEAEADGQNVSAKRINQTNLTNTDFSKVDGVIVLAGTNDYGGARHPIDQFEANVRVLIENFAEINPKMEVYFVTPPFRVEWNNPAYPHDLKEYIAVIKELCTEYNLPCKDLFHEAGVNQFNHTAYLTTDGLHQNEVGDDLFAEKIAKFLMSK